MYSYSSLYNRIFETFSKNNEKEKNTVKSKLIPIYENDEKSKQT